MKRRAFSLIEVMVAVCLLVVIATIAGINHFSLFQETKSSELKKFVQRTVSNCYKSAKITNSAIYLTIEEQNGALLISQKCERFPTATLEKIMQVRDRIETSLPVTLHLQNGQVLHPPFTLVFYPTEECKEEKSSDPIQTIEFGGFPSNAKGLTISPYVPPSSYLAKAPSNTELYPPK